MSGCCDHETCAASGALKADPVWRRVLWVALAINASMFLAEVGAGVAAGSSSLQADSLDFFGDAANYAISLGVAGMAMSVRAKTAFFKGATLLALGLFIAGSTALRVVAGDAAPHAEVMGIVGVIALAANGIVAVLLFRFRRGDADMRSVWICSRNDAIGNVAVIMAAFGVFGTGTMWPDVLVAAVMAGLAINGGTAIMRHARSDIRASKHIKTIAAE